MVNRVRGIVLICVLCAGAGWAGDWPSWRGPKHDGVSQETDWVVWSETGPAMLWTARVGTGFSSVAVAEGRAYTMGNLGKTNDVVWCLDAVTGKEIWKHTYPEPLTPNLYEGGPNATPTVVGDKVYTLSKEGKLLCLEAKTGAVVWSKDLKADYQIDKPEWGHSGSPLVLDGVIYLNAGAAGAAFKTADGSMLWKNGNDPAGYAGVVPQAQAGQMHLVIFSGKQISGVLPTGQVVWKAPWKTSYNINAADPIISGDMVFVSSGYGTGCGLLKPGADTATDLYKNKSMRSMCYGGTLYQGHVYGFDGQVKESGKLTCLELATGQVKWTQDGLGTGTVTVAGDKLIVLSETGKLVVAQASPLGFKELASGQILTGKCWTVPVLANGLIYARNAVGDLVCVDVRKK